eukprot:365948-Chlamydomonas_euryale.AAC.4
MQGWCCWNGEQQVVAPNPQPSINPKPCSVLSCLSGQHASGAMFSRTIAGGGAYQPDLHFKF